ncbi:hypothetical protein TNIN_391101 [Trichonephila inaurata madagascariensis]|uniref:Uncharacterized protein n=1 Tax=Trichonephila inaurata madagascariensis TaxID=2747483 RepID=A0A8X7C0H1_9ARAC|nr:hypothetical protein TNIN_391101 [Trichonephila inaurata madagascariensis]
MEPCFTRPSLTKSKERANCMKSTSWNDILQAKSFYNTERITFVIRPPNNALEKLIPDIDTGEWPIEILGWQYRPEERHLSHKEVYNLLSRKRIMGDVDGSTSLPSMSK